MAVVGMKDHFFHEHFGPGLLADGVELGASELQVEVLGEGADVETVAGPNEAMGCRDCPLLVDQGGPTSEFSEVVQATSPWPLPTGCQVSSYDELGRR